MSEVKRYFVDPSDLESNVSLLAERLKLEEAARRHMQNVIGECIVALGITNMELADWSTQLPKRIRDLRITLSTTRAEVWREAAKLVQEYLGTDHPNSSQRFALEAVVAVFEAKAKEGVTP